MSVWGSDSRMDPVDARIEDAVFTLMETTDIPDIRVADVVRLAGISRSTFYRRFGSVDDVVKAFETDVLANMHSINSYALKARFGQSELDPTPTMIRRMEVLAERRDKIVALNGPHGDPQFVHKATILMHDHFRERAPRSPRRSLRACSTASSMRRFSSTSPTRATSPPRPSAAGTGTAGQTRRTSGARRASGAASGRFQPPNGRPEFSQTAPSTCVKKHRMQSCLTGRNAL